jgi:hypothetical protein
MIVRCLEGEERSMRFQRGLWLSLIDTAGEETPVAGEVSERRDGLWILEAMIPPQVYPVTFVAAVLRLEGRHLGRAELQQPITTVTHEPLDIRIEIPVRDPEGARPAQSSSQPAT